MSWSAEIEEIHRRRRLAEECGGAEAVARHRAQGKLTVRERIARLFDAGCFQEVGKLAGHAEYGATASLRRSRQHPYVVGIGKIDGRPVAIGGEDYTISAAARARAASGAKAGRAASSRTSRSATAFRSST